MASGLPVVSSRSAGEIGDRIREGETGWIVPAGDAVALADRLRLLVDDPARAASMGAAARDSVRWRTPARWADEFESLVRAVMAR
jgi:glycosyltransferase involved in cell wall biosynthesis